jgi:hypothetical protein
MFSNIVLTECLKNLHKWVELVNKFCEKVIVLGIFFYKKKYKYNFLNKIQILKKEER